MNSLEDFFSSSQFMPHIHCYMDNGKLVWTMVTTDALIGISYLLISYCLYFLVRKIKLPFQWIFLAFGLFIFACGMTHFMEIYNLWVPNYWLAALVKIVTAGASVATAIILFLLEKKIIHYAEDARALRLNRTTEFLDSLIENIPNMVFVKDAKDLRFFRFNKAGEELLGYKRSELIGKNDFDFFPDDQAQFFVSKDRAVLAGKTVVDIPNEEIRTLKKGTRILHTRKIPLFDSEGNAQFLLGISEDITDQIKAEQERLRVTSEKVAMAERELSNKRATFIANTKSALVSSLDSKLTLKKLAELSVPAIADWCTVTLAHHDDTYERVAYYHYDPSKLKLLNELNEHYPVQGEEQMSMGYVAKYGKSYLTEIISPDILVSAAKDARHLEILKELGTVSRILVPIPGRDRNHGSIAFITGDSGRIYHPDDLLMAEELGRCAAIAIENANLYESAQKAIQVRDEFLSIASHELKTPITSLKLQLQLTQRSLRLNSNLAATTEKVTKVLESSMTQINRLTRLVEDLLDVSKIQAGKITLEREEVNLKTVMDEMAERFSEQIKLAGSTLDLRGVEPVTGLWDHSRIEQIIENLISNAIKYAPGSPIIVTTHQEGDWAKISVKDFGPGIPLEKQNKIFERFERATASRSISGLGLGLYIIDQIVRAKGGTISLESELGKGATFIISLPLHPIEEVQLGK